MGDEIKTRVYILENLMPVVEDSASEALYKEVGVKALLLPPLGEFVVSSAKRRDEISEAEGHRLEFTLCEHMGVGSIQDLPVAFENELEEA
jgi:hypothetical protein